MADPVSHTAIMSSITEELAKNKFRQQSARNNKPDDAFPRARYENQRMSEDASLEMLTGTHVFHGSTRGSQ